MPEPSSPPTFAHLALGSVAMMIAVGGALVWVHVLAKASQGQEPIEHEPRRPAPWGLIDLIAAVLLYLALAIGMLIAVQGVTGGRLVSPNDSEPKLNMTVALLDSLAKIGAMIGMVGFIQLRTGATLADLGFSGRHFMSDVRLGSLAFAALAIPTYGIQYVLTRYYPSVHPLIEALQQEKGLAFVGIALFAAVVSAPLVEEFFFRVLLQGWCEKALDPTSWRSPAFGQSLLIGEIRTSLIDSTPSGIIFPETISAADAGEPVIAKLTEPGAMPPLAKVLADDSAAVGHHLFRMADVLSILCSTLIFSLMHLFHGPDWIALLVLATGLGYLYRRTHRIMPGLIVHLLLNGFSMAALCIQLYAT